MSDASDEGGSARAALEHLKSVLTASETVEAWAIQRRIFALKHRRVLVAATSGRMLALSRGLLGGFNLTDIRWQDLKEVQIHVGILGATLTLVAFTGPDLASTSGPTRVHVFEGLRKAQAEALYRIAQAHDQAWREKRRVRDLEELRARAGGIQLGALAAQGNPGGAPPEAAGDAADGDPSRRLAQAKSMLEKGLISDSEYESLKARIINQL